MQNTDIRLSRSLRRLLVMGGLAAANHRLKEQAVVIRDASPLLIADEATRAEFDLVMGALLEYSYLEPADGDPMHIIVEGLTRVPFKR